MMSEGSYQRQSVMAGPAAGSSAARIAVDENDTARQLVRIWQELLGIGSIGLNENYFDLGGDSILAIHLFTEIDKVFKVTLPVATLYDAPTVEELARIIRGEAGASGWSPLVAIQSAGSRPPFFCGSSPKSVISIPPVAEDARSNDRWRP